MPCCLLEFTKSSLIYKKSTQNALSTTHFFFFFVVVVKFMIVKVRFSGILNTWRTSGLSHHSSHKAGLKSRINFCLQGCLIIILTKNSTPHGKMRSLRLPDVLKLSPKQAKLNNKVQQKSAFILDLFKILYILKIWEDTVGEEGLLGCRC